MVHLNQSLSASALSNTIFVLRHMLRPPTARRNQAADVTAAALRLIQTRRVHGPRPTLWANKKCRAHMSRLRLKQLGRKRGVQMAQVEQPLCASATKEIHHIPVPCSGTPKADTACPRRARRTAFSCSSSSFLRMRSIILDDAPLSS
jgi:hypothetical protein